MQRAREARNVLAQGETTRLGRAARSGLTAHLQGVPPFDATQAKVPGLVIRGEFDQNAPLSDSLDLAGDYGSATGAGPATVIEIPDARLIPRIEPPPMNEGFWTTFIDFVDRRD